MRMVPPILGAAAAALFVWGGVGAPALGAQDRPLALNPTTGLAVSPFMEGWFENEDGTYTISFGYFNRNQSDTIRIARGPANAVEPTEFEGMQPTVFLPGRHRGVFTVTLPADRRDEDVWWSIENLNGDVHQVPGRARLTAYELDWFPRPHGSVTPFVWFESEEEAGRGPLGATADRVHSVATGEPLTLSINVRDPSERDPDDVRFRDGVPVRVLWFEYSGPAPVEWERHESTPLPEEEGEPNPRQIMLPDAEGTARVVATFSEPGDYVLRAQVDNFNAPDSSGSDQCCWSNGYVRVSVQP